MVLSAVVLLFSCLLAVTTTGVTAGMTKDINFITSTVSILDWSTMNNYEVLVKFVPKAFEHVNPHLEGGDQDECAAYGTKVSNLARELEKDYKELNHPEYEAVFKASGMHL